MKSQAKILLFLLIAFTLSNCTKEDEIPVDVEINDFVWKAMNAYYLYQDQIPDLSDRRFSSQLEINAYARGFTSSNDLFTSLLFDSPTTDNKSVLLENFENDPTTEIRTSLTDGLEYGVINDPSSLTNVLAYVHYILPNSNASTKAIKRGDFFFGVNDIQLTRDNYRNLLVNNPSDTLTLNMAIFDGFTVEEDSIRTPLNTIARKVELIKNEYTHPGVALSKNIISGANNIGYLLYNNAFSPHYINDLNTAFLEFKNQGVNQLVLDLRYNIGGNSTVENMAHIASMITGQFTDQAFSKERWNTKAQAWFEIHQPDSLQTKFSTTIHNTTSINSVELSDLYIILNGSSSSVELLINGLRSYINVHIINSQVTNGNNKATMTLYNSIDYNFFDTNPNHTVNVKPIVVELINTDDTSFSDGFTPDMVICDLENILNLGVLGETSDPVLNNVINLINTGTIASPNCNPNNFDFLYNSLNTQRIFDAGFSIKQDLPNTN